MHQTALSNESDESTFMNLFNKFKTLNIKMRITISVLLLLLASIWGLVYAVSVQLEKDLTRLLFTQQFSVASYIANEIDENIKQRTNTLTGHAATITPQLLADPAKARGFLQERIALNSMFKLGLVLITKDGQGIVDYPHIPERQASSYDGMEYFQEVMATGKPAIGKARIGRFTKQPGIAVAVPVRNKTGNIIAVFAGFAPLSDSTLFGQVEKLTLGHSGYVVIDDPKNRLIVSSSDPQRILGEMAKPGANAMLDRFVAGVEGSGVTVNSKGIEVLTSGKRIPTTGWITQVILPTAEAFAPIRAMTSAAHKIAVGLSVLIALLIWIIIRQAFRPLDAATKAIHDMVEHQTNMVPLPVSGSDELGKLLTSFNLLADQRRQVEEALRSSKEIFQTIQHSITESIFLLSPSGRVLSVNPTAVQRLGKTKQEVIGIDVFSLFTPEVARLRRAMFDEVFRTEQPKTVEDSRDGRFYSLTFFPVMDTNEKCEAIVVVATDITERKQLEQKTKYFEAIVLSSEDAIVSQSLLGMVTSWNAGAETIFGYSAEEMLGQPINTLFPDDRKDEGKQMIERIRASEKAEHFETVRRRKDGALITIAATYSPIHDSSGATVGISTIARDITLRKQEEDELRRSKEAIERLSSRNALLLNSAGEGIFGVNMAGQCTFINPAALTMLDYHESEMLGQDLPALVHYQHLDGTPCPTSDCPILQTLRDGIARRVEDSFFRKNGERFPVQLSVTPMIEAGRHLGAEVVFQDISQRKQMEAELQRLATTDWLTGLANRRHFVRAVEMELARIKRFAGTQAALLMLDLDHFKQVNDTYGHAAGDVVLQAFADCLGEPLRKTDFAGRLGGEEFALLLPGTSLEHALILAERVRQRVCDREIILDERSLHATVSIGVSTLCATDASPDDVLARADAALYAAKNAGRNRVEAIAPPHETANNP